MTLEERRYLDNFDEMFASDGWRQLIQGLQEDLEEIKQTLLKPQTELETNFWRGRADQVAVLLGFEDQVDAMRKTIEEGDGDETV